MTTKRSITREVQAAAGLKPAVADTGGMSLQQSIYEPDYRQIIKESRQMAEETLKEFKPEEEVIEPEAKPEEKQELSQVRPTIQQQQPSILADLGELQQRDISRAEERERRLSPVITRTAKAPVDYDEEPNGFDHSDKLGMLGSLAVGGEVGVIETLARGVQLGLTGLEGVYKYGVSPLFPGLINKPAADIIAAGNKEFTGWVNRNIERNKLYEEAMHSHPYITFMGNVAGSTASLGPVFRGINSLMGIGDTIAPAAAKALNGVNTVAKSVGGDLSAVIQSGIKEASSKSIINAQKLSKTLKVLKMAGSGALIGETNFDSEINHYASNAALAATLSLVFPAAGKGIKFIAKALSGGVNATGRQFGINLPIKTKIQELFKYIPFSRYAKMIQDRAKKVVGFISKVKEGIGGIDETIVEDLDKRIANIGAEMDKPGLKYYQREKLSDELSELQRQRDQLGTKAGYSRYLYGGAEEALHNTRSEASGLYDKVIDDFENTPDVDITATEKVASEISKSIKEQNAVIRRPVLNNILEIFLKQEENLKPDAQSFFRSIGIDSVDDMANYVDDYINGDLYKKNRTVHAYLKSYMDDINSRLATQDAEMKIDRKQAYHALVDTQSLNWKQLKSYKSLIGNKLKTAANSVEYDYYARLYGSIADDMEKHAEKYGKIEKGINTTLNAVRSANKLWHNIVKPMQKVIDEYSGNSTKNADNFIGRFIKPDEPNSVSDLIKMMPGKENQAKMAVKAAIFHEAWDRAYNPGVGINPLKWSNEVMKLNGIMNEKMHSPVLTKQEEAMFRGYHKMINFLNENSPASITEGLAEGMVGRKQFTQDLAKEWGIKSGITGLWGFGAFFHPGALLPLGFAAGLFGRLVTTTKGRNFLLKLASIGEKEPATKSAKVIGDIIEYLGYGSIIGAEKIKQNLNRGT